MTQGRVHGNHLPRLQPGFTLAELAIVLVIISLLLGGMLAMVSAQVEQRKWNDTQSRLESARDALIGFAVANRRLPCPATCTNPPLCTSGSLGDEAPAGGLAVCSASYAGYLPARAIGFQPIDAEGFALDAWGNRIRYALAATLDTSVASCNATTVPPPTLPHFNNAANLKANGISCKPGDLVVCSSSPATVTSTACDPNTSVTNQHTVVAIVFSTGKNGATGGTGTNEARNLDGNALFVSRTPDPAGAAGGEFDDQVLWISVGTLYAKLIAAGALP
jgi:prepilin-type N-terminal cleavage/methylation domain-containing protein